MFIPKVSECRRTGYDSDMSFPRKSGLLSLIATSLCSGSACDEWPRYRHETSVNSGALSPEQPPQDGLSIEWTELEITEENNNAPGNAVPLTVGDGILARGTLAGLGWSPDEIPDRLSDCGETRAFPPAAPGNYIGDVDWLTLVPSESGTLCMKMGTDTETARLDIPLYVLDECEEPISVFVHPDTERPIGLNVASSGAQWAIPVAADTVLGVGMAGFFPDDDQAEVAWWLNLSLAPSVEGAGDSLCPEEEQ